MPDPVLAGEKVTIIDGLGLTRAVKEVSTKVRVEVDVDIAKEVKGSPAISLVNMDGLAPDQSPSTGSKGKLVFEGITQGTWRIEAPEQVVVRSVKIR